VESFDGTIDLQQPLGFLRSTRSADQIDLIVDFATDVAEVEARVSWDMLLKPAAIFLIAGALRLLRNTRSEDHTHADIGPARVPSPNQP